MYDKGFYITSRVSNNAFSWYKRENRKLYVAPLISGRAEDVEIGGEIVFEDCDDSGKLKSCKGLANFITFPGPKNQPVYIFDNHNHAFYFWHLERNRGHINDGALLIHVDQHKDSRKPEIFLSPEESRDNERVFKYTNSILNVGNFIPPARHTGLIHKVLNIDSGESVENFDYKLLEAQNLILDIDMDFFAPELDFIDYKSKVNLCRRCVENAAVVTIATSPFFIDQELAVMRLKDLMKNP
jgi:hypothetical protein